MSDFRPRIPDIRQHPERAVPDEAARILAAGMVAHVGFVENQAPVVIPFSYQYSESEPDRLYLHGGRSGRALATLAAGEPVCVTVTLLDGLVYSRSALYHSMNYRSAVCFGRAGAIEQAERKRQVLDAMIERYFPGRTAPRDYAPATGEQLAATALVEIRIEAMSAKARRGGPAGPLDSGDPAPGTCGVIALREL